MEATPQYKVLIEAGERLLRALAEEYRANDLNRVSVYSELLLAARRRVDSCAAAYCAALDQCGYPDISIRYEVECRHQESAGGVRTTHAPVPRAS